MSEYKFDASGKILGRLASEVAVILMDKNTASFAPNKMPKNTAVVINTDGIAVTGSKLKNKKYYRHSGFIGNLKISRLEEEMKKDSRQVLYNAIWNMLPKNKLRKLRLKNLKLYKGLGPNFRAEGE